MSVAAVRQSMKNLGLGSALSWGLNGYFGLSTYQEARQEGHGVVGSAIRGVGETALAATLSLPGYLAFEAARNIPSLAYDAFIWQKDYRQQLGREQKQLAFQNAAFQETQATYTMRQAGMAIAERSRYNTQQAMLGNEARYMMK